MIDLIPMGQIINATKISKTRLAYLTKLRLLPQSIRQRIGDRIEGCYPHNTINRIAKIENLKDAGLTYSQIRFQLAHENDVSSNYSPILFLVIGLVLGYLFAVTRPEVNSRFLSANTVPPLDQEQKSMVTIMTTKRDSENNPIYLIAVPNQNLNKLGQTNINELIK